jgi:hypothetical protein
VGPSLAHKLSQLPLRFEPNRGQASRTARFVARAGGFTLSVNRADTVVSSGSGQVRIGFSGSNQTPRLTAEQPLEGRSNYLLGRKSSAWIKDVPGYGRVRQSGIYPGIDIVYYGKEGKLEYDFEVSAGADPRAIRMHFEGAARLAIDQDGNLAIDGPAGTLKQHRPVIYQKRVNGERQAVAGGYVLDGKTAVRFEVGEYDAGRALVIDPVLTFGSYLGSSGDEESYGALAVDSTGAIYVGGESVGLPVGPGDYPTTTGSYQTASKSRSDGVISKISPDGTKLIYSTYIGGAQPDAIQGISLAADGSLYFCGTTFSSDFPTTAGVVQRTYGGGISDAFVGHLNASGSSLLYSTFVGGAGQDACAGVVLTPLQHVVAGIYTESSDLRTSTGAAQAQYGGAGDLYFVDLGGEGTALVSATYLGGQRPGKLQPPDLGQRRKYHRRGRHGIAKFSYNHRIARAVRTD